MMFKLCLSLLISVLFAVQNVVCDDPDPADDPKNIEKPCPNFDEQCIREYFGKNSKCQIAQGPIPEPMLVKYYRVEFAHANISVEVRNSNFRGFIGKIVEFYVNSKTEKLVLAVEVASLDLESTNATFIFNRKAKEPIMRSDTVNAAYGTITFTVVFPNSMSLDLDKADVFSYIENAHPDFTIGPNISSIKDPETQKQFQKFMDTVPIDIEQVFISQGRMLMINYIQQNICHFDLKSD